MLWYRERRSNPHPPQPGAAGVGWSIDRHRIRCRSTRRLSSFPGMVPDLYGVVVSLVRCPGTGNGDRAPQPTTTRGGGRRSGRSIVTGSSVVVLGGVRHSWEWFPISTGLSCRLSDVLVPGTAIEPPPTATRGVGCRSGRSIVTDAVRCRSGPPSVSVRFVWFLHCGCRWCSCRLEPRLPPDRFRYRGGWSSCSSAHLYRVAPWRSDNASALVRRSWVRLPGTAIEPSTHHNQGRRASAGRSTVTGSCVVVLGGVGLGHHLQH
jgi:hypothetical protein